MYLVNTIIINFKEDIKRSFPELRLLGLKSPELELELELKSPELELELELKLIVSSGIGIGIGIENNGIGIGIELKKWNWPQPWLLLSNNIRITHVSTISCEIVNKANLRDLIAATGLVILLKLDSNCRFFAHVTLKFDGWPRKIIWHVFYTTSSFVYHIISYPSVNSNWSCSPETPNLGQIRRFFSKHNSRPVDTILKSATW